MQAAFDGYMAGLGGEGPVNELRRDVLAHARQVAQTIGTGLFTLTVPTSGGKTLTSLGFALEHALRPGLRRLIFVIPYASIVEQTADAYRNVFACLGDDVVLEHHANADWDGEDESEEEQRCVMGASWDVPIVVTTAVQFFESLHAARKKRCRKLPSLARSVIVLDEAQTLPLALLRPPPAALRELMEGYGTSVVLSTATQPALTKAGGFPAPEALEEAREIAPDPAALFARLRRVCVRDAGAMSDAALAARMREAEQALLIVAPPAVEQFAAIGRAALARHGDDPIGQDAVAEYFRRLWSTYGCEALDTAEVGGAVVVRGLLKAIESWGRACHYEKVEAAFRVIPDGQPALSIIGGAWGVDPATLDGARHRSPGTVARLLQPHTVSVPSALWHQLRAAGLVAWWEPGLFKEQFAVLNGTDHYDDRAGVRADGLEVLHGAIV